MIELTVHRDNLYSKDNSPELLLVRTYYDQSLTLENVLELGRLYIENEQLNVGAECKLRAVFCRV